MEVSPISQSQIWLLKVPLLIKVKLPNTQYPITNIPIKEPNSAKSATEFCPTIQAGSVGSKFTGLFQSYQSCLHVCKFKFMNRETTILSRSEMIHCDFFKYNCVFVSSNNNSQKNQYLQKNQENYLQVPIIPCLIIYGRFQVLNLPGGWKFM